MCPPQAAPKCTLLTYVVPNLRILLQFILCMEEEIGLLLMADGL